MARTGSSSKFVPVNLNNSYGQNLPLSNGGTTSSGLGRSRSFSNSYGSMVSLSRPSRVTSSSSSSATVSRTSKLAVPRPVNLPSLRREHSGNDPSVALVGSLGSSGWNKQSGEDSVDVNATRSDALKGDATTWGNRLSAPDGSSQAAERRLLSGGRHSTYSTPGLGEVPIYGPPAATAPVAKAVVFRGEDFPSLQAAAAPPSPSIPPLSRSRDSQQKQKDNHPGSLYADNIPQHLGDDPRNSNRLLDRQLQPAQPVRMHARSTFLGKVDDDFVDRGSTYPRGPSPLIKLTHTSNWADDERETLSNVRTQESAQQSDWSEKNDGFHRVGNWSLDCNADIDFRRPTSRVGYPGRNEPGFSTLSMPASKFVYVKDADLRRGHFDGGRFENHSRGDFERLSNNFGRNDVLRRGWSFPAGADYNVNREVRYTSPNSRVDQDGYSNGRAYFRDGKNARHDASGRDNFPQGARPGSQHQDGGQWHGSKFGKDVFLGRQGFPGSVTASGPRLSRGTGFAFSGFDAKAQSGMDYKREKRVSEFYDQVHNEDPFLGDGISSRPPAYYVSQQKLKKESLNADDYRDPARESFEAELERVERMLEQERQRAIEERDRVIELARKEQEEQERIAREEEELRLKLEEEANEAAYRAQKEAEEAARRVEEARRTREEDKRMADLEEDRRKEAARRKLLELEERMAKRDLEKREEEVLQKERASTTRTVTKDVTMDSQEGGMRKNEINRDSHWKSLSSSKKVDQDSEQGLSKALVSLNTPLPSILTSPRLSPLAKEGNGFSIEGGRITQTWKRDTSISGHGPRSAQKGPPKFLQLQTDRSQQDSDQQRGPFLRNVSAQKSPVRSNQSRAPDDSDERDWWARDTNRSISIYPQSPDLSDYPPYGRVRQSLPRQPRVLPPPPGNAMSRRQTFQADEPQSGGSGGGTKYAEGPPPLNEENRSLAGGESAGIANQNASAYVSKPFGAVPSEEVVLSDAGSQFSDDTIEDVVVQSEQEQEQEPDSDVVSETYTDREVDEISDLTEAQESSEDGEPQKPADWEVCQGDQTQECIVRCLEEAKAEVYGSSQEQPEVEEDGLITCSEIKGEDVDRHIAQNADSSTLIEDAASASLEGPVHAVSISEQVDKQTAVLTTELQDGQEAVRKAEELTSERTVQDQEMHPFLNQASFISVGTSDVAQIRHLEGLSSRQSLVQQFQQPFSFMAVPLPQSGTLNNAGASLPMLSSVHTLSNQEELPFHVQLGLLPSMPLLPNAIQIGSIQMPLHIHPQIPQLTHLHGHQQAPVFQFGQIGSSLALSQPISMPQMSPSPAQVLNAPGQNISTQHSHLQTEIAVAEDTNINSADCIGTLDNVSFLEDTPFASTGHDSAQNEHTEVAQGAYRNSIGSTITVERETDLFFVEPKVEKGATETTSKLDAQAGEKMIANDKLESTWVGDSGDLDKNARPSGRHAQGGRRWSNPRYQGILGRGRGRGRGRGSFHGRGGHHYSHQASQVAVESWPEGGTKTVSRGKMYPRNYRRAEYRVRQQTRLVDPETAAPASVSGPSLNIVDAIDGGAYRYIKRRSGGYPSNGGDENGPLGGAVPCSSSQVTAIPPPANQSVSTTMSKSKSILKKYEVENAEDAPFRTGVVRVFEQPGIEIPNEKDDFIKVRSKRQLLRELREQREKENKSKMQDVRSKEPVGKKQQRSSAKIGVSNGTASPILSKNIGKRRSTRSDGKSNMPGFSNGTIAISSATSKKRSLTPSKTGRVASAFKAVSMESAGYGDDNHASEHSTTAAWGGQRSSQEVVSLTQIQLEEAMKPFRLDVPFSESTHSPVKALSTLEPVLPCSSSLPAEKIVTSVKASGPLSSLLAGEKIQFGAVTSPTLIPPDNCSPTPASAIRTGSPIDFGSDPPPISSHTNSFVTGFLDSHLDATYSLKGDSERKDDGYEAKVVDLEAEAAAEAAASAVVAAAISSEDLIDSHPDTRVSEMNVGCNPISSGSSAAIAMTGRIQRNCASDNSIAVALPADLSVEIPPSLFQASSMTLQNSSGAPTFPCLEMGPLIGGPVFNFGPDGSRASMEPGISGWQQRHVGAPDSFYGAPPFLGPAGLSSIQGHPHMLVYTNPYTPVGQFGQLGVSFMGATYHPSGKQPDWSHVPLPSASSGALVMNDGDLTAGSNGLMASQHQNGASNLIQTQRTSIAGSSVMSVTPPPNLFDPGFAAPFQVPQMDALVQSHWSKAPSPPVHSSVSAAGSTFPLSRPAVDFNVQVQPLKVLSNQGGHRTNLINGSSGFRQLSMMNPATGRSFSSPADACSQFPDELGLGDSLPTVSNMQSGAIGPLSDADHVGNTSTKEAPGMRVPRYRHSSQSSHGHMSNANNRGLISNSSYPEQNRSDVVAFDSQSKSVGRIGSPGMRDTAVQFLEKRASKQSLPRDNAGGEWNRGSLRKGTSGRLSSSERAGSLVPSKVKQIYVAKPAAGDSRKLSTACS